MQNTVENPEDVYATSPGKKMRRKIVIARPKTLESSSHTPMFVASTFLSIQTINTNTFCAERRP